MTLNPTGDQHEKSDTESGNVAITKEQALRLAGMNGFSRFLCEAKVVQGTDFDRADLSKALPKDCNLADVWVVAHALPNHDPRVLQIIVIHRSTGKVILEDLLPY